MALFNRTYTFVDGTTAYGSQVEAEIANIVNVLNSLNSATTNWGQVSILHATNVPLVADCAAGSQDIADFKNNSVVKASISSTGVIKSAALTASSALATDASKNLVSSPTLVNAAGYIIGTIVQSVTASSTTQTTTTSGTYQSTNTTASITPKATTHKIRITVVSSLQNGNPSTTNASATIFRGSTDLSPGGASNGFITVGEGGVAVQLAVPAHITYLDSPATTSATTYTVKIRNVVGGATIAWGANTVNTQYILLEEIAV